MLRFKINSSTKYVNFRANKKPHLVKKKNFILFYKVTNKHFKTNKDNTF